ncbi:MAG: ABC transporter substrate-binding protein, partial [Armatimonadetes bacterium]|nr:ABC transporter substrate-binding protein [Armatimonadota bacterium]
TFPLTGEVASYGQKAKKGIELAIEDINKNGGVLGRKVTVDFQDDRNDKKQAVSIVTKFATIDKVPVILGSAGSGVTLAVAPIANQNKVLLVSPISSSTELSTKGGQYFFRTAPADDQQAEILANWVADSGAKNVAVVYTNNAWGKPLADGFSQRFSSRGGKVILAEGVAEGSSDFRTIIAKLKRLPKLDAVVSPTYPKEGGVFVRQIKELGFSVPLFGGDNWGSPEFRKIAGRSVEGVRYTAPSESASPEYKKFAKRYKTKFKEDPDIIGACSYDAAMAVFKAMEASKSVDATNVKAALGKVSFVGVSGNIAFKENGDLASEAFGRMTIKSGKVVVAKP